MKKVIITLLICMGVFTAFPCAATGAKIPCPASVQMVQPRWAYLNTIRLTLTNSGGNAACSVRMDGETSITSIDAYIELIQIGADGTESTVASWSEYSGSYSLRWGDTVPVEKGFKYRLAVTADVTNSDGGSETVYDEFEKQF